MTTLNFTTSSVPNSLKEHSISAIPFASLKTFCCNRQDLLPILLLPQSPPLNLSVKTWTQDFLPPRQGLYPWAPQELIFKSSLLSLLRTEVSFASEHSLTVVSALDRILLGPLGTWVINHLRPLNPAPQLPPFSQQYFFKYEKRWLQSFDRSLTNEQKTLSTPFWLFALVHYSTPFCPRLCPHLTRQWSSTMEANYFLQTSSGDLLIF